MSRSKSSERPEKAKGGEMRRRAFSTGSLIGERGRRATVVREKPAGPVNIGKPGGKK